jgi:hypothetical protein
MAEPAPAPVSTLAPTQKTVFNADSEPVYARYQDDPEAGYGDGDGDGEPGILLQTQQRLMDG